MARCYPVNLILEGQDCLVVGGGRTGERRALSLLEAGARVRVVSLEATARLQQLAEEGRIALYFEEATEQHLEGAFVVIAATSDEALNRRLAAAARANRQLINVVDVPDLCSFYVPSSVRRGPLLFTVGSDGEAPALSKSLRKRIESEFGAEYGEFAEILGALRERVKRRFATQPERAAVWSRIVDSEALELLRQGRRAEAVRLIEAFLESE